jgi:hypothetical protein
MGGFEEEFHEQGILPVSPGLRPNRFDIGESQKIKHLKMSGILDLIGKPVNRCLLGEISSEGRFDHEEVMSHQKGHQSFVRVRKTHAVANVNDQLFTHLGVVSFLTFSNIMKKCRQKEDFRPDRRRP